MIEQYFDLMVQAVSFGVGTGLVVLVIHYGYGEFEKIMHHFMKP